MGPYILLGLVLVGLFTPLFWTIGVKLHTAFLITVLLVSLSAFVASSWSLFARWIIGIY